MPRLSAFKEFAFMSALHKKGFPVPKPYDVNRHCIAMQLAHGYQLNSITALRHPATVLLQRVKAGQERQEGIAGGRGDVHEVLLTLIALVPILLAILA